METTKLALLCMSILTTTNVNGQLPCVGTPVKGLPTLAHNVSGFLFIEDDTTFNITEFYYDGLGPDTFLYFYFPGDEISATGGGVYTRVSDENVQFELGRPYLGETLRFSVPEGHRSCDYGGFSIWCRRFSVLFTWSYLNSSLFSDDGAGDSVMCRSSPGRAYVGVLPTLSNGVSGDLFVRDNKTLAIRNFNYDGVGDDVFVSTYPVGVTPDSSNTGDIIAVSDMDEGQFEAGTSYTNEDLEIIIPTDDNCMVTCQIGTFTIWSRQDSQFYTQITFNLDSLFTNNPLLADYDKSRILCDHPNTRPGVLVGELTKEAHDLEGTFYVQDDKTFYIQLFSYDGEGPSTFLYYYRRGQTVQNTGGGYKINLTLSMDSFPVGTEFAYKKQTPFVVDLNLAAQADVNACDIEWFTLWCEAFDVHFTRIQIPQSIFTTDPNDPGIAMKTKVLCTKTGSTGGAPPSVSLLSVSALMLVALVTLFTSVF